MLKQKDCDRNNGTPRFGGQFCDDEQVMGFILVHRDVTFDPATFTKTILNELIQQDKLIGTIQHQVAEDINVDAAFTDLTTGESIKNNNGLKKWNVSFYKGTRFQNQLQLLDNSENYSIIWVFADGSILVQQLKDGRIKGLNVKLFTGIRNIKTGAENTGSVLRIDLTTSAMKAWQGSSAVYSSDEVDFTELLPVEQLNLDVPILVSGDTSTTIAVTRGGSKSPMIGLTDKDNWMLVRNGIPEAVTAVASVGKNYTFTHAALLAGQEVKFVTNMGDYPIYVLDNGYFIAESVAKKVV